jgi:putative nucleotidyltransferase with HDIG domain
VVFIQSLREDLERRDLTINAMAIDPIQRALIDPMGGEQDLGQRLIRAVGTPAERLAEDALRAMRAIRFAAVLEFSVHPDTLSAIEGARSALAKVSWERIRDELLKILAARKPSLGIHLMRDTGLMQHLLPELLEGIGMRQNKHHLEDPYEHAVAVCDATEGDPILRLTALLHDIGKPRTAEPHATKAGEQTFYGHEKVGAEMAASITKRLKLSSAEQGRICHLIARHNFFFSGWSASGLRRFIRKVGIEHLPSLYALRRADLLGRKRAADAPDPLEQLEQMWERINEQLEDKTPLDIGDLVITGRDVMDQLQIASGPRVGQILRALLEKVLDDPSLNERDQLQALTQQLHRDLD